MDPTPPPPRRWLLHALLALWVLQFAERVLVPMSGVAAEESVPPTAAALLAAGYPWFLSELQYMPFCGGCTAETLLAMPWFWLLGPRIAVWKLVPLAAGLALLVAGWFALEQSVADPAEGRRRAAFGTGLLVFGPPALLANTTVAYGSHFEVTAGILGVSLLWARWLGAGDRRASLLLGLAFGLLFWFSYSSTFVGPTLLLLALLRPELGSVRDRARAIAWTLPGVAVGLLPWLITQLRLGTFRTGDLVYGHSGRELVGGAAELTIRAAYLSVGRLGRSLLVPLMPHTAIGVIWLVAAIGAAVVAGVAAARGWRRGRPLEAALPMLLVAFVLQFLLLAPVPEPPLELISPNGLRYLVPGLCLLVLLSGVGLSVLCSVRVIPERTVLLAGAALLFAPGAAAWLAELDFRDFSTRALSASITEPWVGLRGPSDGRDLDEILAAPRYPLSAAHRHRQARWVVARSDAAELSGRWSRSGRCDGWSRVAGHIQGLPPGERQAWIEGISAGAPDRWVPPTPWARPDRLVPDRSCPGVLVMDAGIQVELLAARISHHGDSVWGIADALRRREPTGATRWLLDPNGSEWDRLARRAVAQSLGRAMGESSRRMIERQTGHDALVALPTQLPAELHADLAYGAGLGLGRYWGHRGYPGSLTPLPWSSELVGELHRGFAAARDRWYVR